MYKLGCSYVQMVITGIVKKHDATKAQTSKPQQTRTWTGLSESSDSFNQCT